MLLKLAYICDVNAEDVYCWKLYDICVGVFPLHILFWGGGG
jgi:hypothetical protein